MAPRDEEVSAMAGMRAELKRAHRDRELQTKAYEDQQAALRQRLAEMEEALQALRDENRYLKSRAAGPRAVQGDVPESQNDGPSTGPNRILEIRTREDLIPTRHMSRVEGSNSREVDSPPTFYDEREGARRNSHGKGRVASSIHQTEVPRRVIRQAGDRADDQGHRRAVPRADGQNYGHEHRRVDDRWVGHDHNLGVSRRDDETHSSRRAGNNSSVRRVRLVPAGIPYHPRDPAEAQALEGIQRLNSNPFTPAIMNAYVSRRYTPPQFKQYSGEGDPLDHLSYYKHTMALHACDDALMCRVFPSSLAPTAMAWFYRLEPESIDSFHSLSATFMTHYITSRKEQKHMDSLFEVVKGQDSLRTYVTKFKMAILLVDNCHSHTAMVAFQKGLDHKNDLRLSLAGKPPQDLREIFVRAEKFCKREEERLKGLLMPQTTEMRGGSER